MRTTTINNKQEINITKNDVYLLFVLYIHKHSNLRTEFVYPYAFQQAIRIEHFPQFSSQFTQLTHKNSRKSKKQAKNLAAIKKVRTFALANQKYGSLAQLNRAFDYGSKGYRFESYRSHSLLKSMKLLHTQTMAP